MGAASEALLRRWAKEGAVPALHPLIDLCNAASLAFAIPVAVFDTARITGTMTVRLAHGDETYETFARPVEPPNPAESSLLMMTAARMHAAGPTVKAVGPPFARKPPKP